MRRRWVGRSAARPRPCCAACVAAALAAGVCVDCARASSSHSSRPAMPEPEPEPERVPEHPAWQPGYGAWQPTFPPRTVSAHHLELMMDSCFNKTAIALAAGGGGGVAFGVILGALPGGQMDTLEQVWLAGALPRRVLPPPLLQRATVAAGAS